MSDTAPRGAAATPPAIHLRAEVFDNLAEQAGASSEADRARLVEVDRTTLYRLRERKVTPSFEVAMRIANRLGVTVDELFEQVSA